MALYAIADLHLSLGGDKPMDIFPGWGDHARRLEGCWRRLVEEGDTVLLPGDLSWGLGLAAALEDMRFIDSLPGKKLLLKGNHDYWWSTRRQMESFFAENGLTTLSILHNNSIACEGWAICGTRGWMLEPGSAHDAKLIAREEGRLAASLAEGAKLGLPMLAALHYPPIFADQCAEGIVALLEKYRVRLCCYGHLHGAARGGGFEGERAGVRYRLVSADQLGFCPLKLPAAY